MQRTLSALFIVLFVHAVGGVPPTVEARTHLHGTYISEGFRSCTVASTPFNNDPSGAPTVISGEVFRQNAVDAGTFTFNEDGTGTQTGRSTTLGISTTAVGASILSISEFTVPFTYVVSADSTLDISFGEGTFAIVLGEGAGETGTTSPRSDHLQLGQGANEFVAGPSTHIEQETVHFNLPHGGALTQYRLCVRSGGRARAR
jgi:hypothetical protein